MRSPEILLGFAAFVATFGLTHVCEVAGFWWHACRLCALLDAFAAVSSIGVTLVLPSFVGVLPRAPTAAQSRRCHDELRTSGAVKDRTIERLSEMIAALRLQVEHLERMRRTGLRFAEQARALEDLKAMLQSPFAGKGA